MDEPVGGIADPGTAGVELCASSDLAESGTARLFDVRLWNQPARAFALRHEGRAVAYINRCAHVPAEMDWIPGEFLDAERRFIVCSIHGAEYDPADGRCAGGPCGRGRLIAIALSERSDRVYWYPSPDVKPQLATIPNPATGAAGSETESPRT